VKQSDLPRCPECGLMPEWGLKKDYHGLYRGELRCPYNHYRVPLNGPVGSEDRAKEKLSSAWIELTANIHEAGK